MAGATSRALRNPGESLDRYVLCARVRLLAPTACICNLLGRILSIIHLLIIGRRTEGWYGVHLRLLAPTACVCALPGKASVAYHARQDMIAKLLARLAMDSAVK